MPHKFESVSVQIFVPSYEPMDEGRDYELWSLHDYRHKVETPFCGEGLVCPDTVSEIIVEALLANGYRLADAEALEADPDLCPEQVEGVKKVTKIFNEEDKYGAGDLEHDPCNDVGYAQAPDNDPNECDCSADIKGVLCDECEKGENS